MKYFDLTPSHLQLTRAAIVQDQLLTAHYLAVTKFILHAHSIDLLQKSLCAGGAMEIGRR